MRNGIKYLSNGIKADTIAAVKKFNELGYTDSCDIIGNFRGQTKGTWIVGFNDAKKWIGTCGDDSSMLDGKEEIFLNEYKVTLISVESGTAYYSGNTCSGRLVRVIQEIDSIDGMSIPKELIVNITDRK